VVRTRAPLPPQRILRERVVPLLQPEDSIEKFSAVDRGRKSLCKIMGYRSGPRQDTRRASQRQESGEQPQTCTETAAVRRTGVRRCVRSVIQRRQGRRRRAHAATRRGALLDASLAGVQPAHLRPTAAYAHAAPAAAAVLAGVVEELATTLVGLTSLDALRARYRSRTRPRIARPATAASPRRRRPATRGRSPAPVNS